MTQLRLWTASVLALGLWATTGYPAEDKARVAEEEMVAESGALEIVFLRQESVRKELHLQDADTKKIHDFAAGQWKKAREIHKLPLKEQDVRYDELTKENEQFLSSTLKPEQRKRLDQIGMQAAGLLWAGRPEVETALGLTADQKKKLHDLHKEAHKEAVTIHKLEKGDTLAAEMKKHHEASKQRLLSLLTDEQKAKWKDLAGPPFEGHLHFGPPEKQ